MKKFIHIVLILSLLTPLSACKNKENTKQHDKNTVSIEERKQDKKGSDVVLPEEKGEGKAVLTGNSGDSEDGNSIVIYVDKDPVLMQVGLETYDFDGTKLSFIYVDDKLVDKKQLSDSQDSVELGPENLTKGIHTVVIRQFENDDENSEPVLVKAMKYKVKPIK